MDSKKKPEVLASISHCQVASEYQKLPVSAPLLVTLSLPKTGSTSLAAAFPPGLARHEGFHQPSVSHIIDYLDGRTTAAQLKRFLERRQQLLGSSIDIATFLHWISAELLELWPESRFLLVLRHPVPWVVSYIGMLHRVWIQLDKTADAKECKWVEIYGRRQASHLSVSKLRQTLSSSAETQNLMIELIEFWIQRHQAVCAAIPSQQLWISRLDALHANMPALANWIGFPGIDLGELPKLNRNTSDLRLQTWLRVQAQQAASSSATVSEAIHRYGQLAGG